MDEVVDTVDNSVDQQSESLSGEAKASTPGTGESVTDTPGANGEPTPEGLFDGMTGEQLHKSYKSMQGEYTKQRESMKQLEAYGAPEQIAQWAGYLQNNPRFAEWVKTEQGRNAMGISEGDLDEDQQKALHVVQNIVDQTVEARLKELHQKEIEPLANKYKDQQLDEHFSGMDKKYGAEWRDFQEAMSELSEDLPTKVQDNPSFKNIEALYFQSLAEAGKLDGYAAKQYEKNLKEKQKKATDRPSAHGASAPIPARSMQEAFENAKRAAG